MILTFEAPSKNQHYDFDETPTILTLETPSKNLHYGLITMDVLPLFAGKLPRFRGGHMALTASVGFFFLFFPEEGEKNLDVSPMPLGHVMTLKSREL